MPTTPKTPRLVANYVDMYEVFPKKDMITRNEYRFVLKMFNNLLRQAVLKDALAFRLPYGVGLLGVSSAPAPSKVFDYQHYKETGEKRNLINLHTNGRTLKILAKPINNPLHFDYRIRSMYIFKAHRHMARELAALIKSGVPFEKYLTYETYYY